MAIVGRKKMTDDSATGITMRVTQEEKKMVQDAINLICEKRNIPMEYWSYRVGIIELCKAYIQMASNQ